MLDEGVLAVCVLLTVTVSASTCVWLPSSARVVAPGMVSPGVGVCWVEAYKRPNGPVGIDGYSYRAAVDVLGGALVE